MNTIPYQFQVKGARAIQKMNGRALLADEQGTGKTITSLLYLYRNPSIRPVVIVCPASLKWNWQREILTHFGWKSEVVEGTTPGPSWLYRPSIVIVNYDILSPTRNAPGWLDRLRELKPMCVIMDECQALQNPSAKRTKAVKQLCKKVPHVIAISGTPITNRPAEMFSVLNILRPDVFPSQRDFYWEHCGPVWKPWGWQFKGATKIPELRRKLEGIMIRRLKREVLQDLPEKCSHILTLPLSDEKQYRQAEKDFILWLAQHKPHKLNRAMKAERLTRMGYLRSLAGELKIQAVCEWIENFLEGSEEKLVVFATHTEVVNSLVNRFKKICVRIDGSTPQRERRLAVEKFQNAYDCRLFVGNIDAAGTGLTLTASSTVLFAELGWSPGKHAQASDRVHRISQVNHCSIYYSIAQNTIEEQLIKLLSSKQSVLDRTLDGEESEETEVFNQLIETLLEDANHE